MENCKHQKAVIPFEYERVFAAMPREDVGEVVSAIFYYMRTGEVPDGLSPLSEAILRHIAYVTETYEMME